jgi:hypothetical protein
MKGTYEYTEKQSLKTNENQRRVVSVLELTVGIATGYELYSRGSIPGQVKRPNRL